MPRHPTLSFLARLLAVLAIAPTAEGAPPDFLYTVRPGDNAWSLTQRHLDDPARWLELRRLNRLQGDRLRPGQVLRIPVPWLRLQSRQVRLLALSGQVRTGPAGSVERWTPAREGMTLGADQGLSTGTASSATLQVDDGSVLLLRPDSELRVLPIDAERARQALSRSLDTATASPSAPPAVPQIGLRLELLRGGLESRVTPQAPGTRLEVITPSAATVVRGTEFRLRATDQGSLAEVVKGEIGFGNAAGETALARATGSVAPVAGGAPLPAQPLLPPPDLADLPQHLSATRLRQIRWPRPTGAGPLQLQWLSGPRLLAEHRLQPDATGRLPALQPPPPGRYQLHVRGVDAIGLEGLSAEREIEIITIEPPRPLLPPDEGWMPSGLPLLQWSASAGADRYRLQIDAQDGRAALEVEVDRPQWQAPRLPPGRHVWRIAALECAPSTGPCWPAGDFGPAHTLNVPWPAPELLEPQRDADGRLLLQWRGIEPEALVQLQIAADEEFREVLLDEPRHGDQARLPRPPHTLDRALHVRVRPLPAGGGLGPWSGTRIVDGPMRSAD
ncbi:MAG: hypothetical protein RL654_512 [Pseudomonadota bacterium]|jgi:hypothetical protein